MRNNGLGKNWSCELEVECGVWGLLGCQGSWRSLNLKKQTCGNERMTPALQGK